MRSNPERTLKTKRKHDLLAIGLVSLKHKQKPKADGEMTMETNGRLEKVQFVLIVTLVMNLAVAGIKIVLGLATGIMAIAADGFHSLGDSLSNVVGMIGIRLARRQPDKKHGYGYERFEAVTTLLIVAMISITAYKVFETGFGRLFHPQAVEIKPVMLLLVLISMAVNVATIIYEGGAGRRLKSELLIADASETKGDLWVSGVVIASAMIVRLTGWYWIDGVTTIAVGLLILRVIAKIVGPTAQQLADAQVVDPAQVQTVVMAVTGAKFCHAIRSRGREGCFFLDLHLGVECGLPIEKAHDDVSHQVKLALHEAFPGLKSALIHIEPDNEAGINRKNSVFRDRDSYDLTTESTAPVEGETNHGN